ncbi:MAG: hypothetical protein KJZ73_09625 [Pseudorhodoplanes sp.]|nr:hypothetical protein [Pseudorhodoplanes sp.]MCL4711495.1 hypothetical protein [Pseudorhodoplanes sp.]
MTEAILEIPVLGVIERRVIACREWAENTRSLRGMKVNVRATNDQGR